MGRLRVSAFRERIQHRACAVMRRAFPCLRVRICASFCVQVEQLAKVRGSTCGFRPLSGVAESVEALLWSGFACCQDRATAAIVLLITSLLVWRYCFRGSNSWPFRRSARVPTSRWVLSQARRLGDPLAEPQHLLLQCILWRPSCASMTRCRLRQADFWQACMFSTLGQHIRCNSLSCWQ